MTPAKTPALSSSPQPVYVIYGKDRRLVIDRVHELTEKILGEADPQLALSSYEGTSVGLAEVLDALRTAPFLSPLRLVIVKEADGFISQNRDALEAYLKKPSPTGVLMLVPESFPGNTRLAKQAAVVGEVIACDTVKTQELPAWLARYAAERYHLALPHEAAQALVELAGEELGMLMAEIDKLAAYVTGPESPSQKITVEAIQALVGNNRQINVFGVIDAMTQGNTAQAIELLDRMLSQDRSAEFTAVGAFAWHIRRLYDARILLERKMPEPQIVKEVRVWANQNQFMRQVKQLSIRRIGGILQQLMAIDLAGKTGGNIRLGLENLIVSFSRKN